MGSQLGKIKYYYKALKGVEKVFCCRWVFSLLHVCSVEATLKLHEVLLNQTS